ncbi:MAG: rod-binding protein [Verrucomicrobiota bacterium]
MIPPLQRNLDAARLPLDQLAANPHVSEAEKVAEASRQFEAVLLRQILSQAQKPLFQSEGMAGSAAGSIYQDMVVHSLADQISRAGSFGLSRALAPQLARQAASEASPPPSPNHDAHGNR